LQNSAKATPPEGVLSWTSRRAADNSCNRANSDLAASTPIGSGFRPNLSPDFFAEVQDTRQSFDNQLRGGKLSKAIPVIL
jgi:hypothetical protein